MGGSEAVGLAHAPVGRSLAAPRLNPVDSARRWETLKGAIAAGHSGSGRGDSKLKTLSLHIVRLLLISTPASAFAATNPAPPLATDPAYHQLDFWIGDWVATEAGATQADGRDTITKELGGAVVVENWIDATGYAGKSWFYYYRPEKRWKQVWVTDNGGVKEKALVQRGPDGSVRFRGEISLKDGSHALDQTDLTPLPDGRVHQVISQSFDGGATWHATYDAYYVRRSGSP